MKKIGVMIFLLMMVVSCSFFTRDLYIESLQFAQNNLYITVGNLASNKVTANPTDTFSYYESTFFVDDENIIEIVYTDKDSCIVKGKKSGSAILYCSVGNKKCYCIVNVQ